MKIPHSQENPIDVFNITISEMICEPFKKLNMTPNDITTLSLIFGVISLYFLYHLNYPLFAITFYISYFFDCMDGCYARKYSMVTKFGDYYDHFKDWSINIAAIIILFTRVKADKKTWITFVSVVGISILLMAIQFGCQEKVYPMQDSETLAIVKPLCVGKPEENIKYTKWFGSGTYTFVLLYSIFYLLINRK